MGGEGWTGSAVSPSGGRSVSLTRVPSPGTYFTGFRQRYDEPRNAEVSAMDERDFEGTLVLEQLAAVGLWEEFWEAIDADDIKRATSLMKRAKVDAATIAIV